jgi:hypothetical protein
MTFHTIRGNSMIAGGMISCSGVLRCLWAVFCIGDEEPPCSGET